MKSPCCHEPRPDVIPDAEVLDADTLREAAPTNAFGAGGATTDEATGTEGRTNTGGAESPTTEEEKETRERALTLPRGDPDGFTARAEPD